MAMETLGSFQELRNLFAGAQLDERLLPVGPPSREAALALDLAVRDARPDARDLGAEEQFHGMLDLELVGVRRHMKNDRPSVFTQDRRLLGHERASDDIGQFHTTP